MPKYHASLALPLALAGSLAASVPGLKFQVTYQPTGVSWETDGGWLCLAQEDTLYRTVMLYLGSTRQDSLAAEFGLFIFLNNYDPRELAFTDSVEAYRVNASGFASERGITPGFLGFETVRNTYLAASDQGVRRCINYFFQVSGASYALNVKAPPEDWAKNASYYESLLAGLRFQIPAAARPGPARKVSGPAFIPRSGGLAWPGPGGFRLFDARGRRMPGTATGPRD